MMSRHQATFNLTRTPKITSRPSNAEMQQRLSRAFQGCMTFQYPNL